MVHYNRGRSWKLDRKKHSQESWEKAYRRSKRKHLVRRRRHGGWYGESGRHARAARKGRR